MWQAARGKILDKDFQDTEMLPIAKSNATNFMHTIHNQLLKLGSDSVKGDAETFHENRTNEMTKILLKAMILKGRIRTAPDYYDMRWPKSGTILDRTQAEELHESVGRQEVAWGIWPVIVKKATMSSDWKMVCLAKVDSRPKKRE